MSSGHQCEDLKNAGFEEDRENDMTANLTRPYAHEVVTDIMHNQMPNLVTAQRARDQTEIIREQRDELAAALQDLLIWARSAPGIKQHSSIAKAEAALAKAGKGQS